MKLTKAKLGGIDWSKLSQGSLAIKQVTADYNARECVVNGGRVPRTEMAISQKISRIPEIRPLRGIDESPKKRKFLHSREEIREEAAESSPSGSAAKKIRPDLNRYV